MNTKSLLTRIGVPVLSLAMLGGLGATLATSASAAVKPPTATVIASTQESNVPDTTSGTMTRDPGTGGGPVWAYDDVTKQFQVLSNGNGSYTVNETVNGTFHAFSEPNTRLSTDTPIDVTGQMHGTNTFTVQSNVAPDASKLPAQINYSVTPVSTNDLITDIFGGPKADLNLTISGGNNWVFAYHAAHGSMTQRYDTPSTEWGNITG